MAQPVLSDLFPLGQTLGRSAGEGLQQPLAPARGDFKDPNAFLVSWNVPMEAPLSTEQGRLGDRQAESRAERKESEERKHQLTVAVGKSLRFGFWASGFLPGLIPGFTCNRVFLGMFGWKRVPL